MIDLLISGKQKKKKKEKIHFYKYALLVNYFGQGPALVINDISLKLRLGPGLRVYGAPSSVIGSKGGKVRCVAVMGKFRGPTSL